MNQIKAPKLNTVVFTFGRMNPPTVGHQKLIDAILATAKTNKAEHIIYVSQTQKAPKDPLSWKDKIHILRKTFPGVKFSDSVDIKTPFDALIFLAQYYENVILVVGDDRKSEFEASMTPYANKYIESKAVTTRAKEEFPAKLQSFKVVSAGARDPDAEGVEGMSASKAREYAANDDFANFEKCLPSNLSKAEKENTFQKVKLGIVTSNKKVMREGVDILPNTSARFKLLKNIMKSPIPAHTAHDVLSHIIQTSILSELIDSVSSESPMKDFRDDFVHYLKAEYPQIVDRLFPPKMVRCNNENGSLSPLGHEYEN